MMLLQPKPATLIVEPTPLRDLFTIFVLIALCLTFGFREGPICALLASGLTAMLAWRGARHFEYLRVVFDGKPARVDIYSRTGKHRATVRSFALGEIGSVEVQVTSPSKNPIFPLALLIRRGPHAGQHPLNRFPIVGGDGLDPALTCNSWLRHNP